MEKEKLERLYVVCTSDTYTIYYRPTYQYLCSCDKPEIKSILKKLLAYSTEDFYSYLIDKKVKLPNSNISLGKKDDSKDHEEWYQQAWKSQTENLFSKLKLKMIYEDIPHDFIKDKLDSMKSKSWGIDKDKPKKKIIKRISKDLKENEAPKESKKGLKKVTRVNTLSDEERPNKKELKRIKRQEKRKKKLNRK